MMLNSGGEILLKVVVAPCDEDCSALFGRPSVQIRHLARTEQLGAIVFSPILRTAWQRRLQLAETAPATSEA